MFANNTTSRVNNSQVTTIIADNFWSPNCGKRKQEGKKKSIGGYIYEQISSIFNIVFQILSRQLPFLYQQTNLKKKK